MQLNSFWFTYYDKRYCPLLNFKGPKNIENFAKINFCETMPIAIKHNLTQSLLVHFCCKLENDKVHFTSSSTRQRLWLIIIIILFIIMTRFKRMVYDSLDRSRKRVRWIYQSEKHEKKISFNVRSVFFSIQTSSNLVAHSHESQTQTSATCDVNFRFYFRLITANNRSIN